MAQMPKKQFKTWNLIFFWGTQGLAHARHVLPLSCTPTPETWISLARTENPECWTGNLWAKTGWWGVSFKRASSPTLIFHGGPWARCIGVGKMGCRSLGRLVGKGHPSNPLTWLQLCNLSFELFLCMSVFSRLPRKGEWKCSWMKTER